MKIYISGKIGDLPEAEVAAKFEHARRQVEAFGHEPVSPLNNGLDSAAPWEDHMGADIAMMLKCDAVYMLTDWGNSRGARIEHGIAHEMGMDIILQAQFAEYKPK